MAGFWRRSLALAIDLLILVLFFEVVVRALWHWSPPERLTEEFALLVDFTLMMCWLAYLVGLRLMERGTLGYRLVGIRYAYMFNETPGALIKLYRAAIAVFLLWAFGLSHFWMLFDPNKQTWHDKVSGFYVVKRRALPRGEQNIVRRVINFMMFSFVIYEPQSQTA